MKITYKNYCFLQLLSLILAPLIASVSVYTAYSAFTTTVNVFPTIITAGTGQNFNIHINISNVIDLYAWEFRLSWNPYLLDAVSAVEGPFLKSSGNTFFTYKMNNTAGYFIVDCTLLGLTPGASGNGVLATLTFQVENVGECPLDIYAVTLLNSFEQTITCQTVDGYGYFNGHDIAVTQIAISPITVVPGEIVDINVTIQNQGGFNEIFNVTSYANSYIIGVQLTSLSSGSCVILQFTWNTEGFEAGEYTILALVDTVPNEVDIIDNNKTADNPVTILYLGHDVAVTNIKTSKTIVGQGYSAQITVTVKNFGIFEENFDTRIYANETVLETRNVILSSGNSLKINFPWDTTNFVKGNYTIKSTVETVLEENLTDNNILVDGWVVVTIPGDINGDYITNFLDSILLGYAFNSAPSVINWNPNADINDDNVVNFLDSIILGSHFGQTVS